MSSVMVPEVDHNSTNRKRKLPSAQIYQPPPARKMASVNNTLQTTNENQNNLKDKVGLYVNDENSNTSNNYSHNCNKGTGGNSNHKSALRPDKPLYVPRCRRSYHDNTNEKVLLKPSTSDFPSYDGGLESTSGQDKGRNSAFTSKESLTNFSIQGDMKENELNSVDKIPSRKFPLLPNIMDLRRDSAENRLSNMKVKNPYRNARGISGSRTPSIDVNLVHAKENIMDPIESNTKNSKNERRSTNQEQSLESKKDVNNCGSVDHYDKLNWSGQHNFLNKNEQTSKQNNWLDSRCAGDCNSNQKRTPTHSWRNIGNSCQERTPTHSWRNVGNSSQERTTTHSWRNVGNSCQERTPTHSWRNVGNSSQERTTTHSWRNNRRQYPEDTNNETWCKYSVDKTATRKYPLLANVMDLRGGFAENKTDTFSNNENMKDSYIPKNKFDSAYHNVSISYDSPHVNQNDTINVETTDELNKVADVIEKLWFTNSSNDVDNCKNCYYDNPNWSKEHNSSFNSKRTAKPDEWFHSSQEKMSTYSLRNVDSQYSEVTKQRHSVDKIPSRKFPLLPNIMDLRRDSAENRLRNITNTCSLETANNDIMKYSLINVNYSPKKKFENHQNMFTATNSPHVNYNDTSIFQTTDDLNHVLDEIKPFTIPKSSEDNITNPSQNDSPKSASTIELTESEKLFFLIMSKASSQTNCANPFKYAKHMKDITAQPYVAEITPSLTEEKSNPERCEKFCFNEIEEEKKYKDKDMEDIVKPNKKVLDAVRQLKLVKPQCDYYEFKEENYSHVLEFYDFPSSFQLMDLKTIFSTYHNSGLDIKLVDDTHALGIFSSQFFASDALNFTHPFVKTRPLSVATQASKLEASRYAKFLLPYKPRPKTCASLARRIVHSALGMKTGVPKSVRDAERQKLEDAKQKRKLTAKQKKDAWEGI